MAKYCHIFAAEIKTHKDMSARQINFIRQSVNEQLTANSYRPEDAAFISRSLSTDALSLIAELGLEVAA